MFIVPNRILFNINHLNGGSCLQSNLSFNFPFPKFLCFPYVMQVEWRLQLFQLFLVYVPDMESNQFVSVNERPDILENILRLHNGLRYGFFNLMYKSIDLIAEILLDGVLYIFYVDFLYVKSPQCLVYGLSYPLIECFVSCFCPCHADIFLFHQYGDHT